MYVCVCASIALPDPGALNSCVHALPEKIDGFTMV